MFSIFFQVLDFNLEEADDFGDCTYDHIELLHGNQMEGEGDLGRICGNISRGTTLTTTNRNIHLLFNSDDSITGRGFWIWVNGKLT